jgi:hypothetical protein
MVIGFLFATKVPKKNDSHGDLRTPDDATENKPVGC